MTTYQTIEGFDVTLTVKLPDSPSERFVQYEDEDWVRFFGFGKHNVKVVKNSVGPLVAIFHDRPIDFVITKVI